MNVIDTRGMTAIRWTAQSAFFLAPYGTVPILLDEKGWRDWASCVAAFPAIAALGAPRPEPFAEWDSWARQFNLVVRLLAT